ncbi:unnamed protein product [Rhizoctonia solani]|uniref:Uncharacterized protein n=1 Tax=Rhizoctonia solani TaxID=456999 RepID=A0A8H3H3I3_9AGAM|nr:unnamed protein product [Rhizoctonia solani]
MRRAKVAPGRAAISQLRSSDTSDSPGKQPTTSPSTSTNLSDQQDSSGPLTPPFDSGPPSSQPSGTEKHIYFPSSEAVWYPNAVLATSFPLAEEKAGGLPTPLFASLGPNVKGGSVLFYPPSSDNYSSDLHYEDVKPFQTFERPSFYHPSFGPSFPRGSISEAEEEDGLEDNLQVKQEMCIVPALDPNTTDNTLPFVLECYARWINLVVFEPTKAVHPMKASIIDQFMRFPDKRSTIILLANTVGSLGKSIHLSPKMSSLVTLLRTYAYQTIHEFTSRPPANHRETDRQNALHTLDLMMEVVLIQRYSYSMSTIIRLMDAAAPVFRRACPEPLDQYVNLPRAVLSPSINIRHFATTDVIMSITTGRPLLFRYDVTYSPDILEQFQDGRYGMQWLHGIADQYIVMLARINVLFEEFGASASPRYIAEIEDQIREVATFTERSSDPVVMIWKFAVRECWKLTMFVYLYMASNLLVLCKWLD